MSSIECTSTGTQVYRCDNTPISDLILKVRFKKFISVDVKPLIGSSNHDLVIGILIKSKNQSSCTLVHNFYFKRVNFEVIANSL